MPRIYIENKEYTVESKHKNLLEACLSLGFDLPYFCWHPVLSSVGACRQCAVKKFQNEQDTRGRIVMACMEPLVDGMRISIKDPEAREFRAMVIEWLMTNHPHDCPVCDEGGECHLQDMTVMSGHNYRRYRFNKRTHQNQYLGPFINHEMNRCIACYRCVRFYRDYAGGKDLNVFSSRNRVYFGRQQDGILESEFSGNLVEVCPTGVFTDKTFKQHYSRKWDLQTAPSVCVHCSLGCNIIAGERYGILRRVINRYNGEVNGYFICDRGRFGYEFVNSTARIRNAARRRNNSFEPVSGRDILDELKKIFKSGRKIAGIGSPRASLEANFALRTLVGSQNFYQGFSNKEFNLVQTSLDILSQGKYNLPSLRECEKADAVLILGEDITNTAPLLDLAVRQAARQQPLEAVQKMNIPLWHDAAARELIQDRQGPLFVLTSAPTKLDEIASDTRRAGPADLARLGFAIAGLIDKQAPECTDLSVTDRTLAEKIAGALKTARNPLIITGCGCGEESVLQAAANIASALSAQNRPAGLFLTFAESNSAGLGLLGGKALNEAIAAETDILIILENDLYRRAEKQQVDKMLGKAREIVVLDHLETPTSTKATILLPAATFAESTGTLVNNEGRAQRFFSVYKPAGDIREGWRWLGEIMQGINQSESAGWETLDALLTEMAKSVPVFEQVAGLAPDASFRIGGQKIPRQSHRYSGRTAVNAKLNVSEPKPADDPDSPFAYSMEGYPGQSPSGTIRLFWAPGWNSVQAVNKFQAEIGGALRGGDPGIALIQQGSERPVYYKNVPAGLKLGQDELQVVPVYRIFGSEELSSRAENIARLAGQPYVLLNRQSATQMKIKENDRILIQIDSTHLELPVRLDDSIPADVIGYPQGSKDLPYFDLPAPGKIEGIKT